MTDIELTDFNFNSLEKIFESNKTLDCLSPNLKNALIRFKLDMAREYIRNISGMLSTFDGLPPAEVKALLRIVTLSDERDGGTLTDIFKYNVRESISGEITDPHVVDAVKSLENKLGVDFTGFARLLTNLRHHYFLGKPQLIAGRLISESQKYLCKGHKGKSKYLLKNSMHPMLDDALFSQLQENFKANHPDTLYQFDEFAQLTVGEMQIIFKACVNRLLQILHLDQADAMIVEGGSKIEFESLNDVETHILNFYTAEDVRKKVYEAEEISLFDLDRRCYATDQNAIFWAIQTHNDTVLSQIFDVLTHSNNQNLTQRLLSAVDKNELTVLHTAAYCNNTQAVEKILTFAKKYSDNIQAQIINCTTSTKKMTPLYLAAKNNNIEIVQLLLDAKADSNIPSVTREGYPLLAVEPNRHQLTKLLLDHFSICQFNCRENEKQKILDCIINVVIKNSGNVLYTARDFLTSSQKKIKREQVEDFINELFRFSFKMTRDYIELDVEVSDDKFYQNWYAFRNFFLTYIKNRVTKEFCTSAVISALAKFIENPLVQFEWEKTLRQALYSDRVVIFSSLKLGDQKFFNKFLSKIIGDYEELNEQEKNRRIASDLEGLITRAVESGDNNVLETCLSFYKKIEHAYIHQLVEKLIRPAEKFQCLSKSIKSYLPNAVAIMSENAKAESGKLSWAAVFQKIKAQHSELVERINNEFSQNNKVVFPEFHTVCRDQLEILLLSEQQALKQQAFKYKWLPIAYVPPVPGSTEEDYFLFGLYESRKQLFSNHSILTNQLDEFDAILTSNDYNAIEKIAKSLTANKEVFSLLYRCIRTKNINCLIRIMELIVKYQLEFPNEQAANLVGPIELAIKLGDIEVLEAILFSKVYRDNRKNFWIKAEDTSHFELTKKAIRHNQIEILTKLKKGLENLAFDLDIIRQSHLLELAIETGSFESFEFLSGCFEKSLMKFSAQKIIRIATTSRQYSFVEEYAIKNPELNFSRIFDFKHPFYNVMMPPYVFPRIPPDVYLKRFSKKDCEHTFFKKNYGMIELPYFTGILKDFHSSDGITCESICRIKKASKDNFIESDWRDIKNKILDKTKSASSRDNRILGELYEIAAFYGNFTLYEHVSVETAGYNDDIFCCYSKLLMHAFNGCQFEMISFLNQRKEKGLFRLKPDESEIGPPTEIQMVFAQLFFVRYICYLKNNNTEKFLEVKEISSTILKKNCEPYLTHFEELLNEGEQTIFYELYNAVQHEKLKFHPRTENSEEAEDPDNDMEQPPRKKQKTSTIPSDEESTARNPNTLFHPTNPNTLIGQKRSRRPHSSTAAGSNDLAADDEVRELMSGGRKSPESESDEAPNKRQRRTA